MTYSQNLILFDNKLSSYDGMFSLILLKAHALTMVLNGTRCFLDGMYFLCLQKNDVLKINKDNFHMVNLCFAPNFVNLNLNFELIESKRYPGLCKKHQYPDFRIFI